MFLTTDAVIVDAPKADTHDHGWTPMWWMWGMGGMDMY
jgi:hypothetical protein